MAPRTRPSTHPRTPQKAGLCDHAPIQPTSTRSRITATHTHTHARTRTRALTHTHTRSDPTRLTIPPASTPIPIPPPPFIRHRSPLSCQPYLPTHAPPRGDDDDGEEGWLWRGAAQRNAAKGAGRTAYRPPATGAERAQSLLTRCPAASGAPARQSHRGLPHGIHPCATPAIAPLRYPRPRIAPHGRRTCENNSVRAPKRRSGAAALLRCSACRGPPRRRLR